MARKKINAAGPSKLLTSVLVVITLLLIARYSLVQKDPVYPPLPRNFDVIVIGSGLSGNLTAIAAARHDADVLYIDVSGEKEGPPPYLPVFWAAQTPLQADAGISYLPETMALDIYTRAHERGNYPQILTVSLQSAQALQWLQSLGTFAFARPNPVHPGLHHGQNGILLQALQQSAAFVPKVVLEHSATLLPQRLLLEDNKIMGVVVRDRQGREEKILSRAVILADGGYASNLGRLEELTGITGVLARADAGHTGLGLQLARELGAKTEDFSRVELVSVLLATGERVDTTALQNVFLFNENGRLVEQTEPVQQLLQQHNGKLFVVSGAETTPPALQTVVVEDQEQLSAVLKTTPAQITAQVPTLTAPYRVGVIGLVALTPGGLSVSETYQVQGEENPITGLYAAGEGTAGLHGNATNQELFFTEIVVGALLAGQNAAAYATR